ncbi:uncharacterized protein il11b [Mustelus asterias]
MLQFCLRLSLTVLSLCSGFVALPTTRRSGEATAGQVATVLHVQVRQLLDQFVKVKLDGVSLKGEHQLSSLPELSGSALELESVQATESLPIMGRYLRTYETHLRWLQSTKVIRGTTLEHRITETLTLLQNLANRVEQEMQRLNLPVSTAPPLSLSDSTDWAILRAGFVILRDLRTFVNKAAHELLALRLGR